VREESHLDEMRAAIRGDFERLERRRGAQELLHVREPEPEPPPSSLEVVEQEPAAAASSGSGSPATRSWLARLVAAIPPRQV